MTTTSVVLDGASYDFPQEYGGIILEIVSILDGKCKVGCYDGYSEWLKPYLQLRLDFLELGIPYQEYNRKEIECIAHEVVELGDDVYVGDDDDDLEITAKDSPLAYYQSCSIKAQIRCERQRIARGLLAKNLYPFSHLEWLHTFHWVATNRTTFRFEGTQLMKLLQAHTREEAKKYPKIKDYLVIPEVIDWNMYRGVRGETPAEFRDTPYFYVLDNCYKLEKDKIGFELARTFLSAHPDLVPEIAKRGYVLHPDYPTEPDALQYIYREACKIMKADEKKAVAKLARLMREKQVNAADLLTLP